MFIIELLNSAENVLDILFVWTSAQKKEMGLTEISRETGINKSTVYKILQSLKKRNLIAMNQSTKKYSLDHGVLELSGMFLKQLDTKDAAHPLIEKLAAESGKTVTFALRKEKHLVFIDRVDGAENVRFYCDIGKVAPYNSGAAAKAVYANLSFSERQTLAQQPPAVFTEKTKNWDALEREVPDIQKRGYSISDEEVDEGVYAVGAPIFDHTGKVIAGMAMATLKFNIAAGEADEMARMLCDCAAKISYKLGYRQA